MCLTGSAHLTLGRHLEIYLGITAAVYTSGFLVEQDICVEGIHKKGIARKANAFLPEVVKLRLLQSVRPK